MTFKNKILIFTDNPFNRPLTNRAAANAMERVAEPPPAFALTTWDMKIKRPLDR